MTRAKNSRRTIENKSVKTLAFLLAKIFCIFLVRLMALYVYATSFFFLFDLICFYATVIYIENSFLDERRENLFFKVKLLVYLLYNNNIIEYLWLQILKMNSFVQTAMIIQKGTTIFNRFKMIVNEISVKIYRLVSQQLLCIYHINSPTVIN